MTSAATTGPASARFQNSIQGEEVRFLHEMLLGQAIEYAQAEMSGLLAEAASPADELVGIEIETSERISRVLGGHLFGGDPVRLSFDRLLLSRKRPAEAGAAAPAAGRMDVFFGRMPPLRLTDLLLRCLQETSKVGSMLMEWGATILVAHVVQACRIVDRLLRQLSVHSPVRAGRFPRHFQKELNETLQACTAGSGGMLRGMESQIAAALMSRRAFIQAHAGLVPETVELAGREGVFRAVWMAADGRVILDESLRDFLRPLCREALQDLVRRPHGSGAAGIQQRWAGMLRRVCPPVAAAMATACHEKKPAGIRMGSARVRGGAPLDVWLYVYPVSGNQTMGGCFMAANRAHREFVLENVAGALFYFPPCLLSARLDFRGAEIEVENPIICEPAGGYRWLHPYTGELHPNPLPGSADPGGAGSILISPSDDARRLFPRLQKPMKEALEANICLQGQGDTVREIQYALNNQLFRGETPDVDVLRAVNQIHALARSGLVLAHQRNTSSPRVQMNADQMPYPVKKSELTGALAGRFFPYDPDPVAPVEPGPAPMVSVQDAIEREVARLDAMMNRAGESGRTVA